MSLPWRATPGGIELFVRVTPNAGADRIEGPEIRDDGRTILRIRVAAPADKGRANAAVIALLAKALGQPKSALAVTAGETARLKTVAIPGEAEEIARRLATIIG
ncbi:MAG TPA: DUF167 family protein [Devosia sp.]|nr:DUF167 family protein [Devosia sp.]